MPCRVFLVDDHPVVREAMTELVNLYDDCEVVGEAASGQAALDALARTEADIVVADLSLPGMDGLELTRALLTRDPSTCVLIVSGHQEALYARKAREAGARGFVTKTEIVSSLLPTLQALMQGETEFIHA